jgi:hypothetical protein
MKARYLLLAIVLLGLGYTIGCGSGSNNNAAITCPAGTINSNNTCVPLTGAGLSATSCQGSCPVGYTQTTSGCLPQSTCAVCQGMSGTTCIASSVTGTGVVGTTGYNTCQGSCQVGYTMTQQYGCLPQSSCGVCQGLYNGGQCVPGVQSAGPIGSNGYPQPYGYNPGGYNPGGYNPGYGAYNYGYNTMGYYPGYNPGYNPGYWGGGGFRFWAWGF